MFPDHHPYSQADAEALLSEAAEHDCELVSTEKDVVRLAGRGGALARLQRATRSVPITLRFEGGDQQVLIDQIEAAIARQNLQRAR
jgi:tetraacyldisaccharide 4'-kinase